MNYRFEPGSVEYIEGPQHHVRSYPTPVMVDNYRPSIVPTGTIERRPCGCRGGAQFCKICY